MHNTKKLSNYAIIVFVLANLFTYLLFHIPTLILEERFEWLEYTRMFVTKFIEFILPAVSGVILFLGYREIGIKATLIRALFLSLTRVIYLLPYYYVYYIVLAYDSVEAILSSLLVTAFGTALFFGLSLLLMYIIRVFARMKNIKELTNELPANFRKKPTKEIKEDLIKRSELKVFDNLSADGIFDFSHCENLGIFAAVFSVFAIELVRELVDSILFIVECEGILFLDEIIYMVACYMFLLIELIVGHMICCAIKKSFIKSKRKQKENSEE